MTGNGHVHPPITQHSTFFAGFFSDTLPDIYGYRSQKLFVSGAQVCRHARPQHEMSGKIAPVCGLAPQFGRHPVMRCLDGSPFGWGRPQRAGDRAIAAVVKRPAALAASGDTKPAPSVCPCWDVSLFLRGAALAADLAGEFGAAVFSTWFEVALAP